MNNLKQFVWRDDKPPVYYRPGTSDEAIIQTVLVERKEYTFVKMSPKVVYDIGGNIGVLAVVLATIYPTAEVHSFEPVKSNFDIMELNTASYPNIKIHKYGLGGDTGSRRIWPSDDPNNHGGFSTTIKNPKATSELIQIRDVASAFQEYGAPEVIKIDVEGAEAEIFEAMPNLDRVKWISGELHGIRDFQVLDLLSKYFLIQCARGFSDKVWHFAAVSKSWTNEESARILAE